ncbi:maleylpyruvate isomerase family mycothiol-dependent enzyme [Haloechinothrix sp. YIM 98757]|uniref:Maleylpyruvate isomerase family mycothiol-dependent enzyme n=1 Tax=Haloechinothrix aidingensis TaxID=2752311 RepID=A0A838AEI4_9PSEU|nr:maleylpyruvate isomerase family mycothiol-dependent enzyme [Haloechinothrix aidingensis]MBA0127620.1 maleylpyruvate isomerase family mycothiol-dependent enzyme [Haloechinothrix aidingensis]
MTMQADDLQTLITAEFLALADALNSISEEQWDTPSLCESWRVREVVAHMTMAARYSDDEFMAKLGEVDFDFTRLSDRIARQDAELATSELVANLRSEVMHHWTPPGGGQHGALNHALVHGLDATGPLGLPRRAPQESLRVVLDDLTDGGVHDAFGIDIAGRSLQATDLDWSFGSGPVLRGAGEDLVSALCGRTLPTGRLEGDALKRKSHA